MIAPVSGGRPLQKLEEVPAGGDGPKAAPPPPPLVDPGLAPKTASPSPVIPTLPKPTLQGLDPETRKAFEAAWEGGDAATRHTIAKLAKLPKSEAAAMLDAYMHCNGDVKRAYDAASLMLDARAAFSTVKTADARGELHVVWNALHSPNKAAGLRAYDELSKLGLDEATTALLTKAVAEGRAGPDTEGIMSPAHAIRAAKAYQAMKSPEREQFEKMLKEAPSDTHRALLWKTAAARIDSFTGPSKDGVESPAEAMKSIGWVNDKLASLSAQDAIELGTLSKTPKQAFDTSCGPTVEMIARAEGDPLTAIVVHDKNAAAYSQLQRMRDQNAAATTLESAHSSLARGNPFGLDKLKPTDANYNVRYSEAERSALSWQPPAEPTAEQRKSLEAVYDAMPDKRGESFEQWLTGAKAQPVNVRYAITDRISADQRTLWLAAQRFDGKPTKEEIDAGNRLFARFTPEGQKRLGSGEALAKSYTDDITVRRETLSRLAKEQLSNPAVDLSAAEQKTIADFSKKGGAPPKEALKKIWDNMSADDKKLFGSYEGFENAAGERVGSEFTTLQNYIDLVSDATGATYTGKPFGAASLDGIARSLEAGYDVPIRIGEPGHFQLITDSRAMGTPPVRQFLVADPGTGKSVWVKDADLTSGAYQKGLDGSARKPTHFYEPKPV